MKRTPAFLMAAVISSAILLTAAPASATVPNNPATTSPMVQQFIPTSVFTASWNAVVGTSGSVTYQYVLASSSTMDVDGMYVDDVTSGTVSATSVLLPALPDGVYYWQVRAGDADGYLPWTPDSGQRVFVIDTTAPVVSIASPAPAGAAAPYALSFTVVEDSPLTWTALLDDTVVASGEKSTFGSPTAFAASIDTSALANGAHTLRILAVDSAGTPGETTIRFTISRLAATGSAPAPFIVGAAALIMLGMTLLLRRRAARA